MAPGRTCLALQAGYFFVQACPTTCDDGSALVTYKTKPGTFRKLETEEDIKRSIMNEGSVHTIMIALRDFISYEGGIYSKNSDTVVGAHAVQLVGWGEENGKEYWIGLNSWGETWGEGGYFRIGKGEVGIGRLTHAAKPLI